MELLHASLEVQGRALQRGDISPLDLIDATLRHVETRNEAVFALNQVLPEEARRQAHACDASRQRGPLWGVPWVAKDNLATRAGRTTCGSAMLRHYRSPFDATVVQRLQRAGAVLVGKANCDEFAMGSTTEHSAFGPTRHPWSPLHAPGGSSGGSAAAVAAGFATFALGSDTGGSVRQPAAWCGVVGFKPTYGRVSRYGLVSFANSLDHVGIVSRTVGDAERVLECLAGADPADGTCLREPLAAREQASGPWRLGVPWEWIDSRLGDAERQQFVEATRALVAAGASLQSVTLPQVEYAARCYHVLAAGEAATQLARYDGLHCGTQVTGGSCAEVVRLSRSAGFGAEVKKRILLGTFVLTAGHAEGWWQRALVLRRQLGATVTELWRQCDALLLPTTPTPAARLGEFLADPLKMVRADTFTTLANLTGVPALSLPSGRVQGLPVGVQFLTPRGSDRRLLRLASWAEGALGWEGGPAAVGAGDGGSGT